MKLFSDILAIRLPLRQPTTHLLFFVIVPFYALSGNTAFSPIPLLNMSARRIVGRSPFPFTEALFLVLLACFAKTLAAQEQNESTIIYQSSYFAQYNAVTLTDMIRNIPGGETILSRRGGPGAHPGPASQASLARL